MPDLPRFRRRPLKVEPDPESQLAALVRAIERLATGVEGISETLDSLIEPDEQGLPRLRMVSR